MYIYIYTILFIGLLFNQYTPVHKYKQLKIILYFLLFVSFVTHDGLRWEMGTDWFPYYNHFVEIVEQGDSQYRYDILYNTLVRAVAFITKHYTVFLLINSSIIYVLLFKWIEKMVPENTQYVALLIMYSLMIGYLGMNRQYIAIALCLFSVPYYIEKRRLSFFILNILALGFHLTAIIFPFLLWASAKNIFSYKWIIPLAILMIIVNQSGILSPFFRWFMFLFGDAGEVRSNVYLSYEVERSFISFLIGLLKNSVVFILIFLLKGRINFKNRYFSIALNIYIINILMFILFNNELQFLVGRLTNYYSLFQCVLFAMLVPALRGTLEKYTYTILVLAFAIISFYRSIALYPELFIPYRSVFNAISL